MPSFAEGFRRKSDQTFSKNIISKRNINQFKKIKFRDDKFVMDFYNLGIEASISINRPDILILGSEKIKLHNDSTFKDFYEKVKSSLKKRYTYRFINLFINTARADRKEMADFVSMNAAGLIYVGSIGFGSSWFGAGVSDFQKLLGYVKQDLEEFKATCRELERETGVINDGTFIYPYLLQEDTVKVLNESVDESVGKITQINLIKAILQKYAKKNTEHGKESQLATSCESFIYNLFKSASSQVKETQKLFICESLEDATDCAESVRNKNNHAISTMERSGRSASGTVDSELQYEFRDSLRKNLAR